MSASPPACLPGTCWFQHLQGSQVQHCQVPLQLNHSLSSVTWNLTPTLTHLLHPLTTLSPCVQAARWMLGSVQRQR